VGVASTKARYFFISLVLAQLPQVTFSEMVKETCLSSKGTPHKV